MTVNNKLTLQNGTLLTSIISLRECGSACMQPSDINFVHKSNSLHWIVFLKYWKLQHCNSKQKAGQFLTETASFSSEKFTIAPSDVQRLVTTFHSTHATKLCIYLGSIFTNHLLQLCYPLSSPFSANFEGFFKTCLFRGGGSSLPLLYKEETILVFKGYLKLNLTFSQNTYTLFRMYAKIYIFRKKSTQFRFELYTFTNTNETIVTKKIRIYWQNP